MLSDAVRLMIVMVVAFIVGQIVRVRGTRVQERRAWGTGRAALSRADRREIRRAVREGRPVADQRLALPAVLLGEEARSSSTWMNHGLGVPPHWFYVCGRTVLPAIGAFMIVSGILGHDPVTVVSGIVFSALAFFYLPSSERRAAARCARRDERRRTSVDANRLLAAKP